MYHLQPMELPEQEQRTSYSQQQLIPLQSSQIKPLFPSALSQLQADFPSAFWHLDSIASTCVFRLGHHFLSKMQIR
ncbi:hypothetical protein M2010_004013 [Providencia stuartii]